MRRDLGCLSYDGQELLYATYQLSFELVCGSVDQRRLP